MSEDEKVIEHLLNCDKHPERVSMYTFDNAVECIKQLRKELDDARWWAKEAIDALIEERDEARREVCEFEKYCLQEAAKRGWDCFKETK